MHDSEACETLTWLDMNPQYWYSRGSNDGGIQSLFDARRNRSEFDTIAVWVCVVQDIWTDTQKGSSEKRPMH